MQNNCLPSLSNGIMIVTVQTLYLDAPRKRSAVLCAGRVDCCPQAAMAVVFPSITLLVEVAVFKSFVR